MVQRLLWLLSYCENDTYHHHHHVIKGVKWNTWQILEPTRTINELHELSLSVFSAKKKVCQSIFFKFGPFLCFDNNNKNVLGLCYNKLNDKG